MCVYVCIWKNFLSFCKPREKPHLRIFYTWLCNLWKSGQLWLKYFTSISFPFYYRSLVTKSYPFSRSFHCVLFNHFQLEWFNCSATILVIEKLCKGVTKRENESKRSSRTTINHLLKCICNGVKSWFQYRGWNFVFNPLGISFNVSKLRRLMKKKEDWIETQFSIFFSFSSLRALRTHPKRLP